MVEAASRSRVSEKSDANLVREESESRNADEIAVASDSARLGQDGIIKEVVGRERRDYGSYKAVDSDAELQNASGVDQQFRHTIDVEHKDGSEEAGRNHMSRTNTTGNHDSSSKVNL